MPTSSRATSVQSSRAFLGIRAKVAVALALVLTGTVLLQGAVVILVQQDHLERLHLDRVELIASSLRGSLLNTMLERRTKDLPVLLRVFGQNNHDSIVEIRNAVGAVVAASDPSRVGRIDPIDLPRAFVGPYITDDVRDGDRMTTRIEPLYNRGACRECHDPRQDLLAYLLVSTHRDSVDRHATSLRNLLVASSVLTLVLLFVATWVTLSYLVVKPIRDLARAMYAARSGDLNARVVERPENDEIEWLGRGFNAMVGELATARAALEESYRDKLTHADRFATVGQLASGLAHEIKNPLAGLSGALQVLAAEFSPKDERFEVASEMQRQIDRLDHTVNGLLRFARPQAPRPAAVELDSILEHVLALVSKQKSAHGVEVRREYHTRQAVWADAGQLEQVFLNLCLNAIQAMPHGGKLLVRTYDLGAEVITDVVDTGTGIPEELREQIFVPFFTTKTQGTGLGLAICERIVSQHNGRLTFECPPAGGTCFRVHLPIMAAAHGDPNRPRPV